MISPATYPATVNPPGMRVVRSVAGEFVAVTFNRVFLQFHRKI